MAQDWNEIGRRVEADDEWSRIGRPAVNRSAGQRFVENAADAYQRSGAGQLSREFDPNLTGFDASDVLQAPRIREGGLADKGLDAVFGQDRGFLRTSPMSAADQRERQRRQTYDARAAEDPIRNPGDFGAYLGGQIVGSAISPDSWVGIGKTVATRIASNAAVAGATDVLLQGNDVGRGVQDKYDPWQTVGSAVFGGVIQGGVEAAPRIARTPAARAAGQAATEWAQVGRRVVSDAVSNPVPSFDGPAMDVDPDFRAAERPRAPRRVAEAIDRASASSGVPADFLTSLAHRESGFRPQAQAGTSSARGLFQFTEGTWLDTLARHGDRLGVNPEGRSRADLLALRDDPDLNARAAGYLTRDNADALRSTLGRDPTNGELYAAHFLGEGGARKFVTADPEARAADLFPDAAKSNRSIFYDGRRPRTVAEVRADFDASFGGAGEFRRQYAPAREGFADAPSRGPEAGAMEPLNRRLPDATDEQRALARAAVEDPAQMDALWSDIQTTTGATRREARTRARAMVHQERLAMRAGEQSRFSRLAGDDNPVSPGQDGFRVDLPSSGNTLFGVVSGDVQPDGTWRVKVAELPEAQRGQGLGVNAYERAAREAEMAGARLTSDSEVTPAAARVWEGLERRGWPVERNPLAVEGSRAGVADALGMGDRSWRTPDDSPVFSMGRREGLNLSDRAKPQPGKLNVDLSGYADRINGGQVLPSTGQTVGGLRQAPRPGAVPGGAGEAFAGKTVSDLAADLRATLGLTHRQGRVSMRQALGEYDTGSGVVRTKAVDELDVLAHEATHALEFERKGPALAAALKAHAGEVEGMAYPGAAQGVRREEGFAEFGRWYLTNPDHARKIAPRFYDAFEAAMEADAPDVLAGMRAVQEGYRNLLASASVDVAKASLAYTGDKGPIGNLTEAIRRRGPGSVVRQAVDRLYTWLLDDLNPIAIAERELGKIYLANTGQRFDLKRAQSPYSLARLAREAYAAAHNDVMNGVVRYHGTDSEGPSLAGALEKADLAKDAAGKFTDDALRGLDVYLISRRMVHEWDRYSAGDLPNPPDRNTRAFHEQVIADMEAAHPTWRDAAQDVYGFLENLWRKEFEAGLIGEETYKRGLTEHPDYVPLMRDMSDKGPGRAGKPRGALQFAGGVKAFEGSSRDIISPLSSIMRRSYELNAIIRRNDVMKALDDMAQAAGRGAGAFVERLPAKEIEAVTVDAQQALEKLAEEMGLSGRDLTTMQKFADDVASQDATVTLFRQAEFSPRKGEAVVFVWRDGKKTPLLLADGSVGQEMYGALTGLTPQQANLAVDIMAAGTQALRYGVTLSPEFMGANIVRDAVATWINTDVGFVPGLDTIKGGIEEVSQRQLARRYAVAGGMRGGANTAATSKPFPRTDAEAQAQLQHLRQKGWTVKRFASWRGLAEATDLSETATRLGVFKKAFDQAKRQGLSDYEALIESGFTSRDYLDFGRRGSRMVTAARLVTFLNAALQGLDKTGRVLSAEGKLFDLLSPLRTEPKTATDLRLQQHALKAWAKVSTLGAIGLGLRALYADDPEFEEINDRLRATHWVFKSGGRWNFVPKPFELATLSNALERAYEASVLKDPKAGERFLSDLRFTMAPPAEIPALSVPFALGANRDYLGRPIVPDHLRGAVDPEMQFSSYTSELGKLIGKTFKLSPAQVDYVVTGFGGSMGRYVLQASNWIGEQADGRPRMAVGPEDAPLVRRFVRDVARGSASQSEFWDQVSRDGGKMTRAEGSFRALMRDGKDAEATDYLNRLEPAERAYVTAKVFSEDGSSRDHPLVRAQNVVSVLSDFRRSLRDGDLLDAQGQPINLTPGQRRSVDSALADLSMIEMRAALIESGVKGWSQRQQMDAYGKAVVIGRISPETAIALQTWLQQAKAVSVMNPAELQASEARWAARRAVHEAPADPQMLGALLRRERATSGNRLDRFREAQRQANALGG